MSDLEKPKPWKTQKTGYQEALKYMNGRMLGTITSLRTPWTKVNDATTDGIEFGTTTAVAARPGGFKTGFKDQLIRDARRLNPTLEFNILDWQFEMLSKVTAIRDFSSHTQLTYKELCSAGSKLDPEVLRKCKEYAKERLKYPVDVIDETKSVKEMEDIICQYMEEKAKDVGGGKKEYVPVLCPVDHTLLVNRNGKGFLDMLYDLGDMFTRTKRKYPIAWVPLCQLVRDVEKSDRCEPGKISNYPTSGDIFGADAVMQHSDTVFILDRPFKRRIDIYGPDRYIINDDTVLAGHFIKCRNGDTRISFFKAEFQKMEIKDAAKPPTASKIGTKGK